MPKTSRQIPSGRFSLRPEINKSGKQPVILTYSFMSKKFRKPTGIDVYKLQWDEINQKITGNTQEVKIANHRLAMIKQGIDLKLLSYNGTITASVLKSIVKGEPVTVEEKATRTPLIEYCRKYNRDLYDQGRQTYKTFINKDSCIKIFADYLRKVLHEPDMSLNEITVQTIDDFIKYRQEERENKSIEGINKSLVPIFNALKYAAECECVSKAHITPIANRYLAPVSKKHGDMERTSAVRYLTKAQLTNLINFYRNCRNTRTKESLEMFLFSFYCCGLRFSDILTLRWEHIDLESRRLEKAQYKTGVDINIPISPEGIKILESWQKKTGEHIYVFGLLKDDFDMTDEKLLENRKNSVNRTMNVSLGSVSDKLGFTHPLTMHVARHTFAVMSINAGMDIKILSTLMGHTSVLTTEKTYAKILQPLLNKTVEDKTAFYEEFKI